MPSSQLALAELQAAVALDQLQRVLRRGEHDAGAAVPSQSGRPVPRAACSSSGSRSSSHAAAIEPCSASSACASLRVCAASAKIASESTVIRGSARAQACPSSSASSLTMIPLWIPTTGPCLTGWLLAAIDGWPFV